MKWQDVESGGSRYSLLHLHPFTMTVPVGHRNIEIHVAFGFHVFTDEKGTGKRLEFGKEVRFFCAKRHSDSHQLVQFMMNRFSDSYTRAYFSKSNQQQFYVMDSDEYAIFLTIQKPANTTNKLNCRIVSAYSVDNWGKGGLPRGKLRKMGYVLDRRERGETIRKD